jgi:hypothetical protein
MLFRNSLTAGSALRAETDGTGGGKSSLDHARPAGLFFTGVPTDELVPVLVRRHIWNAAFQAKENPTKM